MAMHNDIAINLRYFGIRRSQEDFQRVGQFFCDFFVCATQEIAISIIFAYIPNTNGWLNTKKDYVSCLKTMTYIKKRQSLVFVSIIGNIVVFYPIYTCWPNFPLAQNAFPVNNAAPMSQKCENQPCKCVILRNLGKMAASVACLPAFWIPCAVLTVLTAFFRLTDADLAAVRPFFAGTNAGRLLADRWPQMTAFPWKALYDWGVYPAWILGCSGLLVWIASFVWKKLEAWRDPGLFCVLVLIVGPGIIVNCLLKPNWGRPRPNAVVEFGGQRDFLPVLDYAFGQEESSFPSGHASMGFYLMTPAFVFYRSRPRAALFFLLLGICAGCTIGAARVVAGGHFPSDVLWAGGVVYFTALTIAAPFGFGGGAPIWHRKSGAVAPRG